ncbi:MAG: cyclopropane-fatty-acyl-phospholipid synthase family protein [Bacteroidota bacterium]|nr:cyclopropane-fatty-acyl-phospholipid synthase family protein [Bacteroidota bacterium]
MSTAITRTSDLSFYERTVLSMLSKMDQGQLSITMPGGELITLGNGGGGISAAININNPDFFKRCVLYGDIGFGESYVDGDWDSHNITDVIKWFLLNVDNAPTVSGSNTRNFALNVLKFFNKLYHLKRSNSVNGSKKNISAHYDLNNDFFGLFLDPSMTYSSAYFKEEGMNLQQAQVEKYERLCQQLKLKTTDHVLEIGSGWGGNAIHIAKNHGCKVTTVTISEEQYKLAKERVEKENLSHKVEVVLKDYREIEGKFDKIVSIEMLEAVGHQFLEVYFRKCSELLKKDGILAIQVITCPDSRYESLRTGVDWIQKHIFPGSLLPSVSAINRAINNTCDLTLVDLKDIGRDYAKTLTLWREQFNKRIDEVKALGFDETFVRKWNYYLCYCEAAFEMRNINTMQMVYSRPNNVNR